MNTINIGLLGLGTVGSGLVNILQDPQPRLAARQLRITRIAVRTVTPERQAQYPGIALTTDSQSIVTDPKINVVVEAIGGTTKAKELIKTALTFGKHVVTANKDLIATDGIELSQIAATHHVGLYYEAAVMGAIPVLRTLRNAYAGDPISRITGIANGTSNFILTQMIAHGSSYDDALALAQRKGFAEANPANDVEGLDATYKLLILTRFAFGMNPSMDDVDIQGITTLQPQDFVTASIWGYAIKPLAVSELTPDGLCLRVAPHLVPLGHPLAAVRDENNAVLIDSQNVKRLSMVGPGAGSLPTANSIVADLLDLADDIHYGNTPERFVDTDTPAIVADSAHRVAPRFVSITGTGFTREQLRALGITGRVQRIRGRTTVLTGPVADTDVQRWHSQLAAAGVGLIHVLPVLQG
ncbi:homoserine dehydrogenase [Lacticaseibacillus thailandensis]|nr:homoserine dehydrogenase [Lacticaseibacillus thailandensis]